MFKRSILAAIAALVIAGGSLAAATTTASAGHFGLYIGVLARTTARITMGRHGRPRRAGAGATIGIGGYGLAEPRPTATTSTSTVTTIITTMISEPMIGVSALASRRTRRLSKAS